MGLGEKTASRIPMFLLSPNDSVAAVTLQNEALLYAFFIVFAAVMARVVSRNLRFDGDFLQATKCAFLQPQQKSCG